MNKPSKMNSFLRSFRTSLAVQWLRLRLPVWQVWVQSRVGELRSHMPHSQKTKTKNRKNVVTNSIKALKYWGWGWGWKQFKKIKNSAYIFFLIFTL